MCTFSWIAAPAQTSALLIAANFGGGLYVCQSHPVLSFTPRKQKYPPSILRPPTPPHLPPPPLGFDPPLQPRWKDDREREEKVVREGERRERDDSSSTSVEDWGREGEKERKRRVLFWWWASHHGGRRRRRAASRGAGAGLSMHTLAVFFVQTETRLTASAYPRFGLLMSLLLFALVYTDVDL